MKFQILTVLWNEPYFTWFVRGCLKSLSFPKNKQAIDDNCTAWNIFCDDNQIESVAEATRISFPTLNVKVRSTSDLRAFVDQHQAALCWQIEQCLASKDRMLLAPPDTVFADGTIANLTKLGREPRSCVAIAHPRVLPDLLLDINTIGLTTPKELVHRIWKEGHLHQSWTDAEVGHPRQNSFEGGVRWQELEPNTYVVTHHLPTVYFADFTSEDLMYFKTCSGFGFFDHKWPGDLLLPRKRIRVVGSSDAGFICEITHKEKNVPHVIAGADPDDFWVKNPHNDFFKQVSVIFRGDKS